MEVLVCLCQAAPEVVSNDALISQCWPNQFISDNPIHKCVAQLRKALKDDARQPQYIKTIPKKGYAIIGQIQDWQGPRQQPSPTWQQGPPYLGSKPYTASHRSIFFGRDQITSAIKHMINQVDMDDCPVMFIMGAQKVGKTSLLRSQILPFLQQPKTPFKQALAAPFYHAIQASVTDVVKDFTSAWLQHTGADSLATWTDSQSHAPKSVIILDQLEVLLDAQLDDQAAAMLALITQLKDSGHCFIILVLGHEHYAQFMLSNAFQQLKLGACQVDVMPPNTDEIKTIIQQPVAAAGWGFEFDRKRFESLSTVIARDASQLSNALPILSQAMRDLCLQLNDHHELTFDAYQMMGQLAGFLANKAESVLAASSAAEVAAFKHCFSALVTIDTEGQPHLATLNSQRIQQTAQSIIQRLIEADLLSTETIDGHTHIKLVHHSLLKECPTFDQWLQQSRLALGVQSEIQRQATVWQNNQQKPAYLLKNPFLLTQASQQNLSPKQAEFLHLSQQQEQSKQRFKQLATFGFMALLMVVTLLWFNNRIINADLRISQQRAEALNLFMMQDLKEKLQPIGQLELLEMVSTEVIRYHQDRTGEQPTQSVNHLNALNTLAEVYLNQGHHEAARELLVQAQDLSAPLAESKNDTALLFQQSQTHYWLGYLQYLQQDWPATEIHWQNYLQHAQLLNEMEPENKQWQLEHSYALNNMGSLKLKMHQWQSAHDHIMASAAIKQQLVDNHPDNSQYLADLSDTISWQASVLASNSQLHAAREKYFESTHLAQQLVNQEPHNHQWIHRLALAWYRLGLSHYDLGELLLAQQYAEQSHAAFGQLLAHDPNNQSWHKTHINITTLLSKIHRHQGDLDMAQLYVNQGLLYFNQYPESVKAKTNAQQQWYRLQAQASLILKSLGQHKAALNLYENIPQSDAAAVGSKPSAKAIIERVKRQLVHSDLLLAANQPINETALRQMQQTLTAWDEDNHHKAMALQIRIAELLQQTPAPEHLLFLSQSPFKNPDYLRTEELL